MIEFGRLARDANHITQVTAPLPKAKPRELSSRAKALAFAAKISLPKVKPNAVTQESKKSREARMEEEELSDLEEMLLTHKLDQARVNDIRHDLRM